MEIKTTRNPKEPEEAELAPASEKSMYLRKKVTPRLRKSYHLSRVFVRVIKLAAQTAVWLGGVALLAWIVVYAHSSEQFNLKTITFVGCKHMDCTALERSLREELPANLLKVDLCQLSERVEQEIWTREAEIRRILPSELIIYVQERTPAVILELRGELMVADEDGILLDRYDPRFGKLDVPVFRGLLGNGPDGYRRYQEENSERIRLGLRMLSELESSSAEYTRSISEVDLTDKSNIRIMLVDDTAEIQIGDRDFLKRFSKLMSNTKEYRDLKGQYGEFASVDLRFDGQIAYKRRDAEGARAGARK